MFEGGKGAVLLRVAAVEGGFNCVWWLAESVGVFPFPVGVRNSSRSCSWKPANCRCMNPMTGLRPVQCPCLPLVASFRS